MTVAGFLLWAFLWFTVRATILAAFGWCLWVGAREWLRPWWHRRQLRRLVREARALRDAALTNVEPMTPEAMEARGWDRHA